MRAPFILEVIGNRKAIMWLDFLEPRAYSDISKDLVSESVNQEYSQIASAEIMDVSVKAGSGKPGNLNSVSAGVPSGAG